MRRQRTRSAAYRARRLVRQDARAARLDAKAAAVMRALNSNACDESEARERAYGA